MASWAFPFLYEFSSSMCSFKHWASPLLSSAPGVPKSTAHPTLASRPVSEKRSQCSKSTEPHCPIQASCRTRVFSEELAQVTPKSIKTPEQGEGEARQFRSRRSAGVTPEFAVCLILLRDANHMNADHALILMSIKFCAQELGT